MKRTIALSVLGLVAGVATTFGQGTILFDSYAASIPTTFVNFDTGAIIRPFPAGITAALMYSLTPITDPAGIGNLLAGWSPAYQYPDSSSPANGLMTASFYAGPDGDGFFSGGGNNAFFFLPTYLDGAPVYFEVIAYSGSSYATALNRGHSAAWGQALTTGLSQPLPIAFAPFNVYGIIPEPTTLALGGLGLAALFLFRHKQP